MRKATEASLREAQEELDSASVDDAVFRNSVYRGRCRVID